MGVFYNQHCFNDSHCFLAKEMRKFLNCWPFATSPKHTDELRAFEGFAHKPLAGGREAVLWEPQRCDCSGSGGTVILERKAL